MQKLVQERTPCAGWPWSLHTSRVPCRGGIVVRAGGKSRAHNSPSEDVESKQTKVVQNDQQIDEFSKEAGNNVGVADDVAGMVEVRRASPPSVRTLRFYFSSSTQTHSSA